MKYYPLFLNVEKKRILVSGGDDTAIAKLRLLLKTEASIEVYAENASVEILNWFNQGLLHYIPRQLEFSDIGDATVIYAANEDEDENTSIYNLAKQAKVLVNVVDTPDQCDFITPAMVDRDPLVVAIGTEGAAPVLARQIKSKLESELSPELGAVLRIARNFRSKLEHLSSKRRRVFWSAFYSHKQIKQNASASQAEEILQNLLDDPYQREGFVSFVGAGPGDPELLTLKARKQLDQADVILYDRLVSPEILELARREAKLIEVGKKGFGPSWSQSDINELMIKEALEGQWVVRLKSGDPLIYGRLDEETEALDARNISYEIVPGISAANAAAASLKVSLTKRERNSEFRYLTGHDLKGFAEHDWRALSREGSCAAIYMGAAQATQLRGRLLMYGAASSTPVIAIENVSRLDQRVISSTLLNFPDAIKDAEPKGPVVILYGIEPKEAQSLNLSQILEKAQ